MVVGDDGQVYFILFFLRIFWKEREKGIFHDGKREWRRRYYRVVKYIFV
jgi:hypothetical protein